MSRDPAQLRDLLERLVKGKVRFVLVGGFAVNAWGYVRGTEDIDIVPDPDPQNLSLLAEILEELGGKVDVRGRSLSSDAIQTFLRAGDKTLVETDLGIVDVLQGLPQIPRFEELRERAQEADYEGMPVLICSLDDLLAMKRAADRPQDRVDIEALKTAHEQDEE